MKKIYLGFLVFLVLLAACSKQRSTDTTDSTDKTYEQLCKENGDIWMEMEETREGKKLSDQMCFGCMIDDNHFCNSENYVEYINMIQ